MMSSALNRSIIACGLMLAAAALAFAAKPTQKVADQGPKLELASMIPESFGGWQIDRTVLPIALAPDLQAKLDSLYNQTLSRTYTNGRQQVMLSVAYGGDQSDAMQVHRPEVCYTAQGFQILASMAADVVTQYGTLPVKRLIARQGSRNEPITYWIVVGDRIATGGLQQKIAQLRFGLTGKVPDGMLVRVSTISGDAAEGYQVQGQFVGEMLAAMDPRHRARISGTLGS